MKIVIAGAGEMGSHLAKMLSGNGHDITVIDSDPKLLADVASLADVLTVEGLSYGKARIISRTVEFVPLTTPYTVEGKKRRGFYFDFGRVYWNKPEGYTYKRDRTWQFNNLKPRTYK